MKNLLKIASILPFVGILATTNVNAAGLDIGVNGNLAMPTGDFADAAGFGFGAGVSVGKSISSKLSAKLGASYLMFGEKNNTTFSIIPILGTVNYYFGGSEKFMPYGSFSLGMYMNSAEFEIGTVKVSTDETKFGFAPGAGFLMPMGSNKLDVSVNYNFADGSDLTYLGINVGYVFGL
ncbi:outer membrane beta-barrel protein [bacterium]|nr:outer membrane beta-barrel protein [bacterium]